MPTTNYCGSTHYQIPGTCVTDKLLTGNNAGYKAHVYTGNFEVRIDLALMVLD